MEPSEIAHYRIIRKLGAGGMGEVFLAEDGKLGRKVAVKMLSERWAGNAQAKQRLINEAKAAASLDHPNICSIYEVGEEDGRVFIVMQYVDGQLLAERIWKTPLPPGEVVDIGIQAAQALVEAHAAGIIHRDIKPQNIVITPRGQLKVLDFGLAKIGQQNVPEDTPTFERLTEFGNVVGTPGFMSPEQLRGKEADARSDIFSLGVTLYECATGVHAFERGTALEVSLRVVTETPTSPSVLNPAVPPRLDRIIARAMAKDPAGRYDSADALRSDLVDLRQDLDGSGAVSRPVSTATPPAIDGSETTRPTANQRSFRFMALIAAAVAATLLALWFAPSLFRRGRHEPPPEAVVWYNRGTSAIREGAYFQATKALERALEIDGSFALARARQSEAYAEIERARQISPQSAVIATAVANVLFLAGKFDESIVQCRKSLELDPGAVAAHTILRWAYELKGRAPEALAAFEQERSFAGDTPTTHAKRAHVLAAIGKREEAQSILNEIIAKRNQNWVTAYEIAIIYTWLGDFDNAFRWLAQAEREHAVGFTFVRVDPHLAKLRTDPRFADLMRETEKTIP